MRTLVTLLLLGLPLAAQLSITVDGQPRDRDALTRLQQAAQAELEALEKDPPADAEVLAARRAALNEENGALGAALRLFDRLAPAKDDDSGQLRHPLALQTAHLLLTPAGAAAFGVIVSLLFGITLEDWKELTTFHITEATDAAPGMTVGRLLKAIVIFTVAVFGARLVREILKRSLKSRGRLQEGSRFAIRTLVSYTIVGIGVLTAISALGLNLEQFGWFITAAGSPRISTRPSTPPSAAPTSPSPSRSGTCT